MWITNEDQVFKEATDAAMDPYLAEKIRRRYAERRRVNKIHRIRISAIYSLEGYTGPGPFVHEENIDGNHLESQSGSGDELVDDDDDVDDEILWLGEFLDSLALN